MLWLGLLGCIFLLLPGRGRAEMCFWLNEATAQGVLGTPVTAAISHPDAQSTLCEYVSKQNPSMRIELYMVPMPAQLADEGPHALKCQTSRKELVGVGNRAFSCMVEAPSGNISEEIVGQVRDRMFVLRCSTVAPPPNASDMFKDKMQNLAEIVSGNMF